MPTKDLAIKRSDFVSNEEVRDRSRQPFVSTIICKRRLRWLGHVSRLPAARSANPALKWIPAGLRKRGRPKMNWRQTVERDLRLVDRRWSDITTLAEDRTRWSVLTASKDAGATKSKSPPPSPLFFPFSSLFSSILPFLRLSLPLCIPPSSISSCPPSSSPLPFTPLLSLLLLLYSFPLFFSILPLLLLLLLPSFLLLSPHSSLQSTYFCVIIQYHFPLPPLPLLLRASVDTSVHIM